MRIQPVQGSGMNAGYDASTGSITISNEGNSPFLYVRVNNKIPFGDEVEVTGYYRFYDFYEVIWDGVDFVEDIGGLKANFSQVCIFCSSKDSTALINDGSFRQCNKCKKHFKAIIQ